MKNKYNLVRKQKNVFAFAILIASIFTIWLMPKNANAQCNTPCRVANMSLGTGFDHENAVFYNQGVQDQYWYLAGGPAAYGPYPRCAVSQGQSNQGFVSGNSTRISVNFNSVAEGNMQGNVNNCSFNNPPYRFQRDFCVNTGPGNPIDSGNLSIAAFIGDLNVSDIRLYGPGLGATGLALSTTCWPQAVQTLTNTWNPIFFQTGVYTLKIDIGNDWTYVGTWPLGTWSGPTAMSIQMAVGLNSANPIFTDNNHFGKKTTLCAPVYPPSPYFQVIGNFCVNSLTDSTLLNISPYNNNAGQNIYSITGPTNPIINISGSFYAHPGSYTIHSQDATGCAWDTTITVSLNPPFAITPPIQCVDTGSQGLVVFHTDTLIVNYGFQINGGPPVGFIDSNIYLNPGTYTVTCIDPFHGYCTSVDTVKIGKIPILTASVTPACIGVNDSSLIWAMAYPAPHVYHYDIFNPANILLDSITNNWIQHYTLPGDTGTYTIFVTDTVYGCADTLTVTVKSKPTPGLMLSTSKGCLQPFPNINTAIITATPTVAGSYLYQINGGTPQISNQFTINDTGAYYVNVIGTNGCSSVPEKIDIGNCLHCNPTQMNLFQSMQWYTNDTSSIDMGVASPTYPIVIDGTLTIDSNLNIFNNPNVYFTPFAKIEMVSNGVPQYLDIQNSTLKACYYHWTGIIADNPNENVNIDQSTLKNMRFQLGGNWYSGGVNMSNGAYLRSVNSNFVDNHIGINIKNVPYSYAGIIENNVFQSSSPTSLSFNGVTIINVKSMQVGGLINISQGNIFNNLMNGIEILRDKTITYSSTIGIFNNKFEDIRFPYYGIIPELLDSAIISASGTWQGAAIYASGSFDNLLTVNVDNTLADPQVKIINCDIGIGSLDANMNISNCVVENATLGIVGNSYRNVNYNIHDNFINRTHIGIGQYGNIATTQVLNNIVNTRDTQMIATFTNAVTYKSPIGIDINHGLYEYDPTGGFYNNIANNHIDLKAKAGIGINNQNSDRHQQILDNTVYLSNNSADPITASDVYACFGIVNMNAKKTSIKANYMYGSPSLQGFNSRNRIGLLMSYSPNNILECNKVKYSRYGFYAWGDNTTSSGNVKFNKFNANEYPWYLLDFGSASPSTFGNVGSGTSDNGNEFISISNPINWLNVGGLNPNLFKVFRNSSSQPNYRIYTPISVLALSESGSSILGNQYFVSTASFPPDDTLCVPDPMFIMGGEDDIDSSELVKAMAIVQDSVEYINYYEVGRWIDKYRLYNSLDVDSLLRNSTPEMLYFYNQQQNGTLGSINDANKRINLLTDTSTNANNFESRYYDAVSINNTISSDDDWEMNEKYVNDLKLKIFSGNIDTIGYDTLYSDSLEVLTIPITSPISAEEKDFLRNLANTCPFVGGNAVYKARNLWSTFSPGNIYDDRLLCILGQNKNMDYTNLNIDSLYEVQNIENQKSQGMLIKHPINVSHNVLEDGEVLIYPNPASTQITVEYKCKSDGEFILFNSVGQQVLKADLTNGNTKVSLLTNDLSKGVYTYKCIFAGCATQMGKLTILK
jgi:hypothetical protein